jgi:hypothetical protein
MVRTLADLNNNNNNNRGGGGPRGGNPFGNIGGARNIDYTQVPMFF